MAVMLEKVRKQFPALARTPTPQRDANAQVAGMRDPSIANQDFYQDPKARPPPIRGVYQTYDWPDMAGVPEFSPDGRMHLGDLPSSDNIFESPLAQAGQMTENGMSPERDYAEQMDFSMIGDLFGDVNNLDLNWQMLDSQLNSALGTQQSIYSGQSGSTLDEPVREVFGNTITGGTGPGTQLGNATFGGLANNNMFAGHKQSSAGLVGPPPSDFSMGNVDYDVNLPLEDVHFNLSPGVFPVSKDAWMDFSGKKGTM